MIFLPLDDWEAKKTPNKGQGIFAKNKISKGIIIGDYIGTIVHPRNASVNEENFYLMYYHDNACISPIPDTIGVHLLNHSCDPNCWIYIYKGHTLFFTIKPITPGEELTISYLLPPKSEQCNPCPHICRCGSQNCLGHMHLSEDKFNKWSKLTDINSKETKKARIRYGKILSLLPDYPLRVPDVYIKAVLKLTF